MRRRFTCVPGIGERTLAAAHRGWAGLQSPRGAVADRWSSGSLDWLATKQRGMPKAQTEEWWHSFNDQCWTAWSPRSGASIPMWAPATMRILEARAQVMIAGTHLDPQQQVTVDVLRTARCDRPGGSHPHVRQRRFRLRRSCYDVQDHANAQFDTGLPLIAHVSCASAGDLVCASSSIPRLRNPKAC